MLEARGGHMRIKEILRDNARYAIIAAAAIVFIYGGRRYIRPIYNTQA